MLADDAAEVAASGESKWQRQQRVAWTITVTLAVHLGLCMLLLLWPYFVSKPQGEYEYFNITHNSGLDPRDNWPFAWHGLGRVLHEASRVLWFVCALLIWPLAIKQIVLLVQHRTTMDSQQRAIHGIVAGATIALSCFMATFGQAIIYWLND